MKGLIIVGFSILFTLTGCSTSINNDDTAKDMSAALPKINHNLFDETQTTLPKADSIFALTPDQQKAFLSYYHQQLNSGKPPHQALANFLSHKLSNFTYYGETLIAQQSMHLNKGNCMSLAILTTALADLVNLKVDYREVESIPIFEKKNNILLSSKHVQAVIYDPQFVENADFFYFVKPAIIIDYFPSTSNRVVSGVIKTSLIARYYTNMAAKQLADNDLNSAFVFAKKAYELDESSVQIINLLGVIHRRAGDAVTAEVFYRFGLSKQPENIDLLKNYSVLLTQQDRLNELSLVEQKVATLYDPNPYNWLKQAYTAQQQTRLRKAEQFYLKTIDTAPYLQEAYWGLYQLYLQKGSKLKAISTLEMALPWTHDDENKQRYHAKLFSLAN
jgi:Tfp pilus assembly protein PilF